MFLCGFVECLFPNDFLSALSVDETKYCKCDDSESQKYF